MMFYILMALMGYISGSILYAKVWGRVFKRKDVTVESRDGNPGTANAFMYGGFWCGVITLICELLKGFIPVFICMRLGKNDMIGLSMVIASPVIGHAFPVFFGFKGGKGIAVTFGSLLGMAPHIQPALIMAVFFLMFSLIIRITPHFWRTVWTYICSLIIILISREIIAVKIGYCMITAVVGYKMFNSDEERDRMKVGVLWMR